MDIEVGYLPKRYYDSNPDAGGFFPFAFEGTTPYVLSLEGFSLPQVTERFLPIWLLNIHAFPLYFCAVVPSYWKEEFEHKCKEFNISTESIVINVEHSVFITEIENKKQFRQIFPFYIRLGSGNDLVVWSTTKDVFRIEPRKWRGNWQGKIAETVVAKLEADTSIFWIGYDGDSIAVISNQSNFSTYEKVIKTFPDFVVPKPIEFG
jgi:hypothetical protein